MRRTSRAFVCLFVLVLLSAPLCRAQTLEDKVQEFTLDNGLKFLVVERHEAPVFFGAVAFGVGSIYERPGIFGISHLLEHMLFKGTQTVGTKDYEAEREYLAREDELAEDARRIMIELAPWRLGFFDEYATDIVASFSEEDREVAGTNRGLELELLIERMMSDGPTGGMKSVGGLLVDKDVDYFDMYVELKRKEMELYDTMAEHRDLIISNEFWETYLSNGARMLNAGTSYDGTFYICALPSNRLELWMLMESDRMENAVFREFYSERDVVMEERRMSENTPEDMLYESFMATAYSASLYGNPVLGWMSDLRVTTRGDLENYFKAHYGPNTATVLLTGDVDLNDVKRLAEKYFGHIARCPDLPDLTTTDPTQQGERRVVVREDAKPSLYVGYHIPSAPHPDSYPLSVLSSILSGGRTSRFYSRIYEEKGLTRDAPSAWIGPGNRLDPLFVIGADPKEPHTLEEVEVAILEELELLKAEPVARRELEKVWNESEAMLVRALGSNIGLAFRVGMYAVTRGDWRTLLEDMEREKEVTPDDIMRVAERYFTPENRTVGWLVETASDTPEETEEEIDLMALMQWVRTLPEEEQRDLMIKFQSLDDKGREALGKQLYERMKMEKGGS